MVEIRGARRYRDPVAATARVSYRAKNPDTLRTGNMGCRAVRLLLS